MVGEGDVTDDAGLPVHPAAHQEFAALRQMFEHLDEVDLHRVRDQLGCPTQQRIQILALEGEEAEVREGGPLGPESIQG